MPAAAELEVDCLAAGLWRGLARELLLDRHRDLLEPLRFLAPGELPPPAPAPAVDRVELARALAITNAAYGHPRAAELAQKLADPATRVVATGQQTGLLGGPLLAFAKAAAATRWAEALEARGEPAVAIFWMATEDHDWSEVAEAFVPGDDGPLRLALGADPEPLAPVGMRTLGAGVERVHAELAARYPRPWSQPTLARLARWWRPDARFGEAFARQLAGALGARTPLVVDAMLPELKRAEAPFMLRLVERRFELDAAFAARERELAGRGFAPQVAPAPGASPLFLLRGGARRRVEWRGGERFALRGAKSEAPVAELLATLADNPAVVSPGALARPALQDAVFGTTLQVLGPGELAYLPQAAAVHELLGLAAPWTTLRPAALVVDARARERLAALDLGLVELLADPDAAERRLGARAGGGFVAPVRERILALVDELETPATALDPALARAHAKTRRTVGRALERLAGKAERAAARRDGVAAGRFAALVRSLRPGGRPQERTLCAAHFELRWGERFGAALVDGLELDPRRLSIVDPDAGRR
jgi:bacillithiol biosynthesis cysteine-adding enzyme BshC